MEIYNPRKERGGRPRLGRREPPPRPTRGFRILLWFGWFSVLVLVLLSIFGETGLLQAVRQSEKRRQSEKEVAALRAEIEELRSQVARLQTSREFVRGVARDGGFVRDNEIVILLDNVPAAANPSRGRGWTEQPRGGPVGPSGSR